MLLGGGERLCGDGVSDIFVGFPNEVSPVECFASQSCCLNFIMELLY